jgi:hypothetical protein
MLIFIDEVKIKVLLESKVKFILMFTSGFEVNIQALFIGCLSVNFLISVGF